MENVIEVKNLTKAYANFKLENVNFSVPAGYICGFIGQNGAGKTTTLKVLLDLAKKDEGEVLVMGHPAGDVAVKKDLGVLLDYPYFHEFWTPLDIEKVLRDFYSSWDSEQYHGYLKRFGLKPKQAYKTLSKGMKMKLGLAIALSHDAKLLLLDEPTSGLDPVMRDEILEIFQNYLVDEERTIFFSSHITSDLEKVADYIVYIHKGRIIFSGLKDDLLEKYTLIKGKKKDLPSLKRKDIIGLREHAYGFEGMLEVSKTGGFPTDVVMESPSLDEIMVHFNRGGEDDDR